MVYSQTPGALVNSQGAWQYLYLFLQSSCLEVPIYWLFYRRAVGLRGTFGMVTTANSMTHPMVIFFFMAVKGTWIRSVLVAELYAVVCEATLHRVGEPRLSWGDTIAAALVANLFSWQVAPMITYFLFYRP